MIVHDQAGREIEMTVCGELDDIKVDSAVYTDTGEDVPDSVIDGYIYTTYGSEMYDEVYQNYVCQADDMMDAMKEDG